jgi:hypothetical protein
MSRQAAFILCSGLCGLVGLCSFLAGYSVAEQKASPRLYELRTYTTFPGRLPALHARFRDHTMKLFEKHGMKNGMYWVPIDEKLKENTLIYVVSHASEEAAKASWDSFVKDPVWVAARDASEKDGKLVQKVERVYMRATDYSPPGN